MKTTDPERTTRRVLQRPRFHDQRAQCLQFRFLARGPMSAPPADDPRTFRTPSPRRTRRTAHHPACGPRQRIFVRPTQSTCRPACRRQHQPAHPFHVERPVPVADSTARLMEEALGTKCRGSVSVHAVIAAGGVVQAKRQDDLSSETQRWGGVVVPS